MSNLAIFPNSKANNSGCSDSICQSQIQQFFQIQGQITADVPIRFVPESNSSETLWAYILWPSLVLIGQYLQMLENMLENKQSQIWQIFEFKGRQLGQFWSDWFHYRTHPLLSEP